MNEPSDSTRLFSKNIEFGYKQVLKFSMRDLSNGLVCIKNIAKVL